MFSMVTNGNQSKVNNYTNCFSIEGLLFRSQFSPSLNKQFRKIFRNCGARTAARQWGHVFELNERFECVSIARTLVGYTYIIHWSYIYRIIHSRIQSSWKMWPHWVTLMDTSVLKCFQQTEQKILLFSDIIEFVKTRSSSTIRTRTNCSFWIDDTLNESLWRMVIDISFRTVLPWVNVAKRFMGCRTEI